MTLTFNLDSRTFTLAHAGNTRITDERTLNRIARTNEWGDVEAHIELAKRTPGKAITVDNRPRVRHTLGHRRIGALHV